VAWRRAAEAVYSDQGQREVRALIDFYLENARIVREQLSAAGLNVYGGVNAPYIWVRGPEDTSSWDLFDKLLQNAHVVGTPGSGFGAAGEGYFRISAFNSRDNITEAMRRVTDNLKL